MDRTNNKPSRKSDWRERRWCTPSPPVLTCTQIHLRHVPKEEDCTYLSQHKKQHADYHMQRHGVASCILSFCDSFSWHIPLAPKFFIIWLSGQLLRVPVGQLLRVPATARAAENKNGQQRCRLSCSEFNLSGARTCSASTTKKRKTEVRSRGALE